MPHVQAVADVLRDAGHGLRVQLAGLLHDVVEETDCAVADVREQFGETVADTVAQLTEDESIEPYAPRKHALSPTSDAVRTVCVARPAPS